MLADIWTNNKWQPLIHEPIRSNDISLTNSRDIFSVPYSKDTFVHATTRLPTPPSTTNMGMAADIDSSRTPSPSETFEQLLKSNIFLPYSNLCAPLKSSTSNDSLDSEYNRCNVMASYLDEQPPVNKSIASLLSLTMVTMAGMSSDTLRYHLYNALEVIRGLLDDMSKIETHFEKKLWDLQACLSGKERELQNLRHQLAVVTQLCEAPSCSSQDGDLYGGSKANSIDSEPLTDVRQARSNRKEEEDPSKITRRRGSGEKRTKQGLTNPEYRRRLDKNATVDWQVMVDKIIQRGDQQASIFMQQKLKTATNEQKQEIFRAVLQQAYALMTSRFGNFLVQRLLEVCEPEQVAALIAEMRDRVVALTCQQFGCHVLQKALEYADEPTRASMVQELCQSIPETFTNKHACHIWQKVFEMRWTMEDPPQVMDHVHKALQHHWTRVALDETGSLVIQHIFENLSEAEKRPVLDEILANLIAIARGQWGNWVVQHILEHAENSDDRQVAFQAILEHAFQLSTDQFASKVVEKALRIGGQVFLEQFLEKITVQQNQNQRSSREPLIDMASDQYGNYVVQWLINHSEPENHRVRMCRLIKKHMVSLRSSKYGQRVAFLVEKVLRHHEITTYPASNTP